jgi:uncharacterized membrane protein YfcA
VTCAGIWALRVPRRIGTQHAPPNGFALSAIGGVAGVTSALSGTGGPLVLMPLLLVRGAAIGDALVYGRIAQFPIALSATIARGFSGGFDLLGAVALSASLMAGMLSGNLVAKRLPSRALVRVVGWALVIAGPSLAIVAAERFVR